MRFGFHISIAGGFSKVVDRAKRRGCETIQFFSRNPRGWTYGPLNEEDVGAFRRSIASSNLYPIFLHMPYLPNMASPDPGYHARSINSMVTELARAEQLKAQYVIIHIGHRMESPADKAIDAVARGINEALTRATNSVVVLLENTAGQGSEIGSTFGEIAAIMERIKDQQRIGVCLDTAHSFGAGYDLSSQDGIDGTLELFDRLVGLKRLHLVHLNDSKTTLGSKRDRHWHIGKGQIGLGGVRYLINHASLRHLPGIMETPRKDTVEDLRNMKVIRSLVQHV